MNDGPTPSAQSPRFRDALGQWVIRKDGPCDVCGEKCYAYLRPELFWMPVAAARTLVAHSERIGITCGCYGKLHRQIAHIEDSQKERQA